MKALMQGTNRNIATIVAHTIFLVILLVLPEIVMTIAFPHRSHWVFYPGFYVKMTIVLAVFYLNYFYLVDKELGRQKPKVWKFILYNALAIVAALSASQLFDSLFFEHPRPHRWPELTQWQKFASMASHILRDAVMLILSVGLAVALRLSTRWADIQLQRQRLLSAQRQSELDSLKSQLNPHFLFNTLNSIYALIDINSDDAKKAVHKLSGMLRYMLYEDQPTVPLAKEMEFLSNYTSLMQLRLRVSDHPLEMELPSAAEAKDIYVPPLIFIPLVENAMKYGVSAAPGLPVKISLAVTPDGICFSSSNGYEAVQPRKDKGGIGLANLRRRLVLIYGNRAALKTCMQAGIFTADLCLPLHMEQTLQQKK